MEDRSILKVEDLNVFFKVNGGIVRAVENVNFQLKDGESIGIVGESGCGKTTTALAIMGMLPGNGYVDNGRIFFEGEDIIKKSEKQRQRYRWNKISMIFQGAMNSLNPVMKISRQIGEAIRLHNPTITKGEINARVVELFKLVGLDEKRINYYPHEFSGGMKQRVMIAMALACNPRLIIGDEPTTALDLMIQAQIIDLINDLRRKLNMGMIIITHDLSIISEICDRVAVMYAGNIVEIGSIEDIIENYKHPYTEKLIKAFPSIYGDKRMAESIPGAPPNPLYPPKGCRFHPRCHKSIDICKNVLPKYTSFGNRHFAACHVVKGDSLNE